MARKIYLGGNYKKRYVVVDDEDYEYIKSLGTWTPIRTYRKKSDYWAGYVQRCQTTRRPFIVMHKEIAERKYGYPCPKGYQVDHINFNPKDNRRCNIQYIPIAENARKRITKGYTHASCRPGWEVRRQVCNYETGKLEYTFFRYCKTENEARLVNYLLKKGYKVPEKRKEKTNGWK